MKNPKVATALALLLLVGMVAAVLWVVHTTFSWISGLDSKVVIAIIAASFTVISSTIAIVLGRYLEKRKEQESAHRDKKIELYDEFTSRLFDVFQGDSNKEQDDLELVDFLREVQRNLILWAGPSTVVEYAKWHTKLTTNPGDPKAETMIAMVDFFLSLRSDLGLSNKGIKREHICRFMLKEPDLFMKMYNANNDVYFSEIIEAENQLKQENKSE